MKRLTTALGIILAAGLATSALAADEIVIGHLADLTGGTADVGKPYADGIKAAAEYINGHGGINGKKIKLLSADYGYKIPEALNLYKKFTTTDNIVALMGWGTGDTEALTQMIAKDEIPDISASYSAHLTDPKKAPYNFFVGADYSTMARAGLKYIKDNWKGSAAPKLALVYPDHPYGKAPIPAIKEYAKELGFTLVGEENVALNAIEATTQLLNLKKNEPDFAWVGGTRASTAVVLKDAKKLGLKTRFLMNIWGNDEMLFKQAGDAAEGHLGIQSASAYGDDVPGMKTILEVTKNQPQPTHFIRGWASMMVMAEGLKRADKAGQLNGPGIKKALESLKDFDLGGLTAPITYTATDHRPNMTANVFEMKGGELKLLQKITLDRRAEWLGL